jgi:iron complex transport system substrate-binding protein
MKEGELIVLSNYKKKTALLLSGLLVMSVGLAACGSNDAKDEAGAASVAPSTQAATATPQASASAAATQAPAEKTMKDALGNDVKIPANPQRIIASYLEDHLVALGIKPVAQWTVANGTQAYLQDSLNGIPTIPYDLPFEAVTSFNPDLLIVGGNSVVAGDKYAQYAKIAPTYTLGDEINGDWRKALLKIGEVLNKSEAAQKALDGYDLKAKEAKAKIQQAAGAKSAAAIWLVQKNFFVVSDTLSSGAVIYKDLGFTVPDAVKEISAAGKANWNPISMEKLAQLNADYIFLINSDKEAGSEALKDPVWQAIPAVKNGQVFEFDRNGSWLYSGVIANQKMIDDVLKSIVK